MSEGMRPEDVPDELVLAALEVRSTSTKFGAWDDVFRELMSVVLPLYEQQLRDERDQARAELAAIREELSRLGGEPDPDDTFKAGHTYRSYNQYFEFKVDAVVGGIAFGIETMLQPWRIEKGARLWKWTSCGPSVGYEDVTTKRETEGGGDA